MSIDRIWAVGAWIESHVLFYLKRKKKAPTPPVSASTAILDVYLNRIDHHLPVPGIGLSNLAPR